MNLSLTQLGRLAFADLFDEWPIGVAVTLAIAAVLAPLLVLGGLQSGVIGEIFDRLRADPAMRRITLDATGARRFDDAWFEMMRQRVDVGFIMPATRFAAAQVDVSTLDGDKPLRVSLVPTGGGDPVFDTASRAPTTVDQVRISASVATALSVGVGDRVALDVERRRSDGRVEAAGLDATIVAVADPLRHGGTVIFVVPELLSSIEAFRDGFAAPMLGHDAGELSAVRAAFPNFRLYAAGIEDVGGLTNYLRQDQELSVTAQEGRIGSAIELDQNIGAVLRAIILLGVVGLAGSLTAIMWASASRKRRTIAMLSLIGYGRSWLIGFPVMQGLVLAIAGSIAGLILASGAAFWINQFFADSFGAHGAACTITGTAIAAGVAVVILFSLLPSVMIGIRFNRLEPSDEIRDM
jgi:putative ABC transport system permease protein